MLNNCVYQQEFSFKPMDSRHGKLDNEQSDYVTKILNID